jgi:isocitrate/isopropylmalate dehydrogenase
MNQAMKVLEAVRHRFDMRITTSQHDVGGVAIDRQGTPCRRLPSKAANRPTRSCLAPLADRNGSICRPRSSRSAARCCPA